VDLTVGEDDRRQLDAQVGGVDEPRVLLRGELL
jgi:hypothetical protein